MKSAESVFRVLSEEGLTTLEVFHNKKEDKFVWRGAKEWDENVAWDRYMTDFTSEIRFAGNPPCRACSRIISALGAIYTQYTLSSVT